MGLLHPGSIAFLPSSSDRPQSKPRLSRMADPPELPRFNSARGAVPHSRAHESMQEPKGFLNLRGSQCSVLTLLGPFCAMPSGRGAFPEPRDFFDRGPEFLFALPFQAQPRFSAFCIYPPLRTPVSRVTLGMDLDTTVRQRHVYRLLSCTDMRVHLPPYTRTARSQPCSTIPSLLGRVMALSVPMDLIPSATAFSCAQLVPRQI